MITLKLILNHFYLFFLIESTQSFLFLFILILINNFLKSLLELFISDLFSETSELVTKLELL